MNRSNATIAVYSDASALVNALASKQCTHSAYNSLEISYSIRQSSSDITGLSDVDAMIYDLSLVKGDIALAALELLHLKVNANNKPLILVGSRQDLEAAFELSNLKYEVAHTIAKPIRASQLRLVSEAAIIKQDLSYLPSKTHFTKPARAGIGMAMVIGLSFLVGTFWMMSDGVIDQETVQLTEPLTTLPIDSKNTDTKFTEQRASIAKLEKNATAAIEQGRLAFPKNHNALAYYDQILEIDGYHQSSYQGRQKLLEVLDGSLAMLMNEGDFDQAGKLLEVLLNAEPFNDKYRRIDLTLINYRYATSNNIKVDLEPSVRL